MVRRLLIIILALYLLWWLFLAPMAEALSPRQARIQREVNRIEAVIRNLTQTLDWLKGLGCAIGLESMCMVEEPIGVDREVSLGHTVRVSFDVRATWYNNVRSQTDRSPCEGAFGNVCQSFERGENPIAVSRDIALYPLGRRARVRLSTNSARVECKAQNGKVFTVMDTMSDCLRRNRNLRTGRCNKPIENAIDIFIPCDGEDRTDDYCIFSVAQARANGTCNFLLTKL